MPLSNWSKSVLKHLQLKLWEGLLDSFSSSQQGTFGLLRAFGKDKNHLIPAFDTPELPGARLGHGRRSQRVTASCVWEGTGVRVQPHLGALRLHHLSRGTNADIEG